MLSHWWDAAAIPDKLFTASKGKQSIFPFEDSHNLKQNVAYEAVMLLHNRKHVYIYLAFYIANCCLMHLIAIECDDSLIHFPAAETSLDQFTKAASNAFCNIQAIPSKHEWHN